MADERDREAGDGARGEDQQPPDAAGVSLRVSLFDGRDERLTDGEALDAAE